MLPFAGRRVGPTAIGRVAAVWARLRVIAIYAALALSGLAAGILGVFVQALRSTAGPIPVRYGVAVAVAGAVGLFALGRSVTGSRAGVIVPASAWFLAILPFTITRPEGDAVLSGNGPGAYLFLALPTLAAAALATVPPPLPRPRR
jgi:hypothetical protein